MKNYLIFSIVIISLFLISPNVFAYPTPLTEDAALRVIIGEAANQDLRGMICVAEVLRRRGTIKGFYGYHAKHIAREPKSTWKLAKQAWEQSKSTNYTNGADHFENIRHFSKPWWAKHFEKTYEYKDHVFYKDVRKKRNKSA